MMRPQEQLKANRETGWELLSPFCKMDQLVALPDFPTSRAEPVCSFLRHSIVLLSGHCASTKHPQSGSQFGGPAPVEIDVEVP